MTANTSPRLGLMLPTNTDPFTPTDFVTTFTKLDGTPGVTPVANLAGLPAGLTASQHGSLYVQLDNQALWMWHKPTSGSTGVWKRVNSLGLLSSATMNTTINTTANTDGAAPTLLSATAIAPGGRSILALAHMAGVQNSNSAGATSTFLTLNGTSVARAATTDGGTGASSFSAISYLLPNPAAGTSMTFAFKMRTANVSGGGGTSTANGPGSLYIIEV